RRRLGFQCDEQPALGAIAQPDLEELVGKPLTDLGPARDLLKLLVERFVAARPIDVVVNGGKEECRKRPQIALQSLFPWTVVIVGSAIASGHSRDDNVADAGMQSF